MAADAATRDEDAVAHEPAGEPVAAPEDLEWADVVVMDISMPGVNGLVATRTLKAEQPGVAVVIITRHGDDAYLQELLRAGAAGQSEQPAGAEGRFPRPALCAGSYRQYSQREVPTMPTSFLLGRDGKVRFIHEGFHGDRTESEIRRQIEALLAEAQP